MNINWFTVGAQVVNFLVLVWLLKRFLYQPILNAMDQRQQNLAQLEEDANKNNAMAEKIKEEYVAKEKDFNIQKKSLFLEAKEDADLKRKEMISESHQHVKDLRSTWGKTLKEEQVMFLKSLSHKISKSLLMVVRKFMSRFSNKSLNEHLVLGFCKNLNEITNEDRDNFLDENKYETYDIVVRSGVNVDDEIKKIIIESLRTMSPKISNIDFEHVKELTMTFELETNSHKIVWGLNEFLQDLEDDVKGLLEHEQESSLESEMLNDKKDKLHA
jgi:F-type H+-transporting ATPase subunit b